MIAAKVEHPYFYPFRWSKCPYCSGYIFLKGFNDLRTTHSEIASEWSEELTIEAYDEECKSRGKMSGGGVVNAVMSGSQLSMPCERYGMPRL